MTTDDPTSPRWTMADLHRLARDQADEVSSLTREALALIRAGGSADRVSRIINDADQALDHLEAVNIDIESRLNVANVLPFARRDRKNDPERPL